MATSKKKILVVDNHALILHFMVEHLGKKGHEVTVAEDALAALDLLRGLRPEIIFIDLIMPKIGGDRFCRILRSKPEFKSTYLVILSAIAAEEQPDVALFGADACIAKGPLARMSAHIQEVLGEIDAGTLRQKKPAIFGLEGIYQRQITSELLSSQRRFESILAHIAEGILEVTGRGQVIYANPVAQELLGIPEELLLAARLGDLFAEQERDRLAAILESDTGRDGSGTLSAIPYGDKFLDLTLLPVVANDNRSILVVIRDISTSLRMKSALRESEQKYRLLFQEMLNGFVFHEVIFDEAGKACDYRFLEVNGAFETISKLQNSEVIGKTLKEVFPEDHASLVATFNTVEVGQHTRFCSFCAFSDRYIEFTVYRSEKDRLAVIYNDLTDRKRLEERLHKASITDELTGILNRRGFLTLAEQQLKVATRESCPLHLLFADLDDLKKINDGLGHKAGDQALAATAAILKKTFRESDIIGRLGGDEFAILLTGPLGNYKEQSVLARLEENMNQGSHPGELSLTCGLARFDPQSPCTLEELISRADQRMYELKRKKKEVN